LEFKVFGKISQENFERELLHRAVIDDDWARVKELAKDPLLRRIPNSAGWTPIELAEYLGRVKCRSFLGPLKKRLLHIYFPEARTIEKLTEDAFYKYFSVTYLAHLRFSSYEALLKYQANCPILAKRTAWGIENRALSEQFKDEMQAGYVADVSVRFIDPVLGYGVFADKDIPKGAYIGEFTGIVRQLSRKNPEINEYCFHLPTRFFSWNYYVVDAQDYGNEIRFVNHSDTPNLIPYPVISKSLSRVIFVAKEDIKAGKQLTYNYGSDFWRHRQKIAIRA